MQRQAVINRTEDLNVKICVEAAWPMERTAQILRLIVLFAESAPSAKLYRTRQRRLGIKIRVVCGRSQTSKDIESIIVSPRPPYCEFASKTANRSHQSSLSERSEPFDEKRL
jgi:hypothetical protein